MKKLIRIAGLMILVAIIACENKNSSMYENCCGTAPVADSVLIDTTVFSSPFVDSIPEYGTIYIPNIFIPDTFGFSQNSIFMVFGGLGAAIVLSEVFSDENGEVLFSRDSFYVNDVFYGWNGVKPDGSIHYGPFNYEVKIQYIDAQIKTYTGKACSFKCDDSGFPNEKLPDCFFPDQNNGNGAPDPSLPQPINCF